LRIVFKTEACVVVNWYVSEHFITADVLRSTMYQHQTNLRKKAA
jgi:hypothetical protein